MDCEANSDVSFSLLKLLDVLQESTAHLPLFSHSTDYFCIHSQDLLCYLIDDGAFLIMSNQKEDWNKVN